MKAILSVAALLVGLTACQQGGEAQPTPNFTSPDLYPSNIRDHLGTRVEGTFSDYLVNGAQCDLFMVLTTTYDVRAYSEAGLVATNPQGTVGVLIEDTEEQEHICYDAITEALSDYVTGDPG